jgi:hypothetical protein
MTQAAIKRWEAVYFDAAVSLGIWLDRREQSVDQLEVVSITGTFKEGWLVVISYWEAP